MGHDRGLGAGEMLAARRGTERHVDERDDPQPCRGLDQLAGRAASDQAVRHEDRPVVQPGQHRADRSLRERRR